MVRVSRVTELLLFIVVLIIIAYNNPQWTNFVSFTIVISILLYFLPVFLTFLFYVIPKPRINSAKKAVFITGCDTGFGHELAKRLFSLGVTVFAGCLEPDGQGATNLKSVNSSKLIVIPLDVTKDESVKSALEEVKNKLGNNVLWGIVNNAGLGISNLTEAASMEEYRKIFEVNTFGVLRVTKAFLPLVRQARGRVVFVASQAGRFTALGATAYSMSKYSVVSLADGLRKELYQFGVKVSTIEPGFHETLIIDTERMDNQFAASKSNVDKEVLKAYGETTFDALSTTMDFVREYITTNKIWRVIDMMEDALLSPLPRRTYDVANFLGFLLFYFSLTSPQCLTDFAFYIQSKQFIKLANKNK